jgi:GTP:adenosylcobinamide-phosphate guanylyltransferase
MDVIVTAGGIPQPQDPLYPFSNGDSKALIDIAGKPMVQWVLDALSDAKQVENVIVIGLSPKSGLTCKKPLHFISNQGRMLANIVAGVNQALEINPRNKYVLVVSSDIPTLKPEMVDWLVTTCMETKDDIYYGVCPRDVMESRFPDSRRSYTRLADVEVCGADINVTHVRMATEHLDTWEALIGNRKSALRQASLIGLDTFFQVAMHSISLNDLVDKVCRRIGIKGRAIVWDRAEPCMDVDKPHQLELLRADLARQERKGAILARKSAQTKAKPVAKKAAKPKAVSKKSARPAVKAGAKVKAKSK